MDASHRKQVGPRRDLASAAAPMFVSAAPGHDMSSHAGHVTVEVTKAGSVRVSGMSTVNGVPSFLAPPLFASLPQAILAAHQWAEENGVKHVFLMDRTAS